MSGTARDSYNNSIVDTMNRASDSYQNRHENVGFDSTTRMPATQGQSQGFASSHTATINEDNNGHDNNTALSHCYQDAQRLVEATAVQASFRQKIIAENQQNLVGRLSFVTTSGGGGGGGGGVAVGAVSRTQQQQAHETLVQESVSNVVQNLLENELRRRNALVLLLEQQQQRERERQYRCNNFSNQEGAIVCRNFSGLTPSIVTRFPQTHAAFQPRPLLLHGEKGGISPNHDEDNTSPAIMPVNDNDVNNTSNHSSPRLIDNITNSNSILDQENLLLLEQRIYRMSTAHGNPQLIQQQIQRQHKSSVSNNSNINKNKSNIKQQGEMSSSSTANGDNCTNLARKTRTRDNITETTTKRPRIQPPTTTTSPSLLPLEKKANKRARQQRRHEGSPTACGVGTSSSDGVPVGVAAANLIPLSLESDETMLSKFQARLRTHICFFRVTAGDLRRSAQGRNKPIRVGQIGVICRHCAALESVKRPRGAMYFPSHLAALYQACQNMASNHFLSTTTRPCPVLPLADRVVLHALRQRNETVWGGGKPYWIQGAKSRGIVERDNYLVFVEQSDSSISQQTQEQEQEQQQGQSRNGGKSKS